MELTLRRMFFRPVRRQSDCIVDLTDFFHSRSHTVSVALLQIFGTFAKGPRSIDRCLNQGTASAPVEDCILILTVEADDKIIRAAGVIPSCAFRACQNGARRKLAWRGELLRKARVYVCKSGRLVMQVSSGLIEECSC